VKKFELVAVHELDDLNALRENQLKEIEKLGRFKDKCGGALNEVVALMSAEIRDLEQQIVDNQKIADLVLIEVKAVFLKHLAKMQAKPQPIPE